MKRWEVIVKRERMIKVEAETFKEAFAKAIKKLEPGEMVVGAVEMK